MSGIKLWATGALKQIVPKIARPFRAFAVKIPATTVRLVVFAGAFACIGVALLVFTKAATNTASIELEDGTRAGGAVLVSDSSASGGNGVMFGSNANILQGRTFTADVGDSTSETGNPIANMTDGNTGTRWISQPVSPVNARVGLGGTYTLSRVTITFAADTIKNYQVAVSMDGSAWTTVATGVTNNTQSQTVTIGSFSVTPKGKYLRITGVDRWNAAWGNSIWEVSAAGVLEPGSEDPDPDPEPGNGTWLSGAGDDTSSYNVANGSFETWRGEYVGVGGTWFDNNQGQVEQWSIASGGVWYNWNRPLDMAIGAIDDRAGESWAAAASGAYDARWRQSAQNLKKNWTDRGKNESYLMVRFAHELNGNWYPWKVRSNEAASFKAAWIRWSNIMDEIVPQAKKVLSVNKNASSGMATVRELWPGKQYVDIYSVDYYNNWPHCVDVGCIQSEFNRRAGDGTPWGLETHRLQALEYGVPLAISEWGNSISNDDGGGGAESPEFITYMNNWMRQHAGTGAGQLYYENYFNLWARYQLNGPQAHQPQTAERYRSLTWGR